MNAKEVNQALMRGTFKSLPTDIRREIVSFLIQFSHVKNERHARNIIEGGLVARDYETFLATVARIRSISNRNIVAHALEPIYGSYDDIKEPKNNRISPNKGESSDDFIEVWKVWDYEQRNKYMDNLRKENPSEYKQKSFELSMWQKYRPQPKPYPNQAVSSVSRITVKNKDGSFTRY